MVSVLVYKTGAHFLLDGEKIALYYVNTSHTSGLRTFSIYSTYNGTRVSRQRRNHTFEREPAQTTQDNVR